MATAEIICVGTELLLGQILNTNAEFLSRQLAELGINLYYQTVVGDNAERLTNTIHTALKRADILLLCGGLGPTEDDLTRETTAAALNRKLLLHPEAEATLRQQFAGRSMPLNNLRQAHVPEGGEILPNPRGTAPGIMVRADGGQLVFLLPGPPRELRPMFTEQVVPRLIQSKLVKGQFFSTTLRCGGIGESDIAERLSDLIDNQTTPSIALYSRIGEVDVRLTVAADSKEQADDLIAPLKKEISNRLQHNIISDDGSTISGALGKVLRERGLTLSLAESCTGGLVGNLITNEAGASNYFMGSVVCYSNASKMQLLGVQEETIKSFGAVSEQCAGEMLKGVQTLFNTSAAIAVTGIAGPGGGSEQKPVGTVFVGVAYGDVHKVIRLQLMRGEREAVKERAAKEALRHLLNLLREQYV